MSLSREFDFPERFEREKSTRLMPETLKYLGLYTLRMMMPPGKKPFAMEFATIITAVESQNDSSHIIEWVWQFPKQREPEAASGRFNPRGFMTIDNSRGHLPNQPNEIEMGYFVGSTDPYDLALAELSQQELHKLTSAI